MTNQKKLWIRRIVACFLAFLMLFSTISVIFAKEAVGICRADDGSCSEVVVDKKNSKKKDKYLKEITMDQALDVFRKKKDAVLYFGFESCPWCKQAKPILKTAAKKTKIKVYYVKTRDKNKKLLYTEKQRKELAKYMPGYMSKNKEVNNKLWLYVPLVVRVEKGEAVSGHKGTIKGYNAKKRKMTAKEKRELEKKYTEILE